MKQSKLVHKIYFPVFIFSLVSFVVVIILTLLIVKDEVDRRLLSQFANTADIFTNSIRDDLINGLDKEINRKCNSLLLDPSVLSVMVGRQNENVCKKTSERDKGVALQRKIFFDEDKEFPAGTVKILFSADVYSKILLRIVILIVFSTFVVAIIYWIFSSYFIKKETQVFTDLAEDLAGENFTLLREIHKKYGDFHSKEFHILCDGIESLVENWFRLQDEKINREKINAKHEVARFIAHDIKSPLSTIKVVSEILLEKPEQAKSLLVRSAERIESMLAKIVKSEDDDLSLHSNNISVRLVLSDCINDFMSNIAYASEIKIIYDDNFDSAAKVKLEADIFKRCIENLLKNAFEAKKNNQEKAQIEITVSAGYQFLKIIVKDFGCGVPPEIIEKLGKTEFSFGKVKGSGLGLIQVKKLCEAQGGRFSITSEYGQSTSVEVQLPFS